MSQPTTPVEVRGAEQVSAIVLADGTTELSADGQPFLRLAASAPDPADWLHGCAEAVAEAWRHI